MRGSGHFEVINRRACVKQRAKAFDLWKALMRLVVERGACQTSADVKPWKSKMGFMRFQQDGSDLQAWRTHYDPRLHHCASSVELLKQFPHCSFLTWHTAVNAEPRNSPNSRIIKQISLYANFLWLNYVKTPGLNDSHNYSHNAGRDITGE